MATSMRLHPVADIFEIRHEGEISYPDLSALLAELERRLRGMQIRKLLIDYSYAWPTDEAAYAKAAFVAQVAQARFTRGATIAFINAPAEHCQAVEGISRKGGFHSGRFYDSDGAIAWLHLSDAGRLD